LTALTSSFHYVYQAAENSQRSFMEGKFTNGWASKGLAIYPKRQPFSVIDYSGALGSAFYGVSDGITNPSCPWLPAARQSPRSPERRRQR